MLPVEHTQIITMSIDTQNKMKNDLPIEHAGRATSPARRRWILSGAVLVIALGAAGAFFTMRGGEKKHVDEKLAAKVEIMELAPGDVVRIEARDLQVQLPVSGALTALHQATVKSKVAGEVRETPIPEGMQVRRGDIVVRLDGADLKARVGAQQAAVEDARARLALARKNQDNNAALLKQKFISQNAVDTAENSVELALAAVKSANAQLDIARRALDDAVVRSPIDGIVSKRFVQPGEKASPDMPLFAVVDLSQLILEAQVPASEIPRVAIAQSVSFTVDGFGTRSFSGKVSRINPAAETGSRAITVYVAVANADHALKSGMFANGGITLEKTAMVPVLPVGALHEKNGATTVYRVDGGKVVEQPVRVGLRSVDEGLVEVAAGLPIGAQVLAVTLEGVKPGTPIRLPGAVTKTAAPAALPIAAKS